MSVVSRVSSAPPPPLPLGGTDPAVFGMCLEFLYSGAEGVEALSTLFDGFEEGVREGEPALKGVAKLRQVRQRSSRGGGHEGCSPTKYRISCIAGEASSMPTCLFH